MAKKKKPKPKAKAVRCRFEWKEDIRQPRGVTAQDFGLVYEDLRKQYDGPVPAQAIVEAATPKGSSIHQLFDWDNKKAGAEWRLYQARYFARHLVRIEVVRGKPRKIRALVHVSSKARKTKGYLDTPTVVTDEEYRNQMLKRAFLELLSIKAKYHHLSQLQAIWAAIDRTQRTIAEEIG